MNSGELGARLGSALEHLNAGRLLEALPLYRDVLSEDQRCAEAWFRLGQIAIQTGNAAEAVRLLERAVDASPQRVDCRYRLALGRLALRQEAAALADLRALIRIDRSHAPAWMKIGLLELRRGDREAAAEAFQRALIAEPALATAAEDERLTAAARQEFTTARSVLRAQYRDLLDGTMAALASDFPGASLQRVNSAFRMLTGEEPKRFNHDRQRPEFLLFPDLPAAPWHETDGFPWVPALQAAAPDIARECREVVAERRQFEPYVHAATEQEGSVQTRSGADISTLAGSQAWTAYYLEKGQPIAANRARCPATAAIIDDLPLARLTGYMPDVLFSLLEPGAHIVPHYGQNNVRLTVHLGLLVPPDCQLCVGDESRPWAPGEVSIFDDSFEHEAWNRSSDDRAVLIFKVWHPDLKEVEIAALERFFATRDTWLARLEDQP